MPPSISDALHTAIHDLSADRGTLHLNERRALEAVATCTFGAANVLCTSRSEPNRIRLIVILTKLVGACILAGTLI